VSIGSWSGVAFVDTGGGSFMAMSSALAATIRVHGEPIGETLGMCVDCSPSSVRGGWLDSIVIGDNKVTDVPVLTLDDAVEPLMIGAPLLRALGGMTIVWNGNQPSLAFGAPSGCDHALPTFAGPHAHLFIRAQLGALGTPMMVLDTGMPIAYTFDPLDLATVPTAWKPVTQTDPGPTSEYVASLPTPEGSHAITRTVRRFRDGAQHADFPGAKSFASHLAFAPLRTCITFDPPSVSVKTE
jgi:hypothetical protein